MNVSRIDCTSLLIFICSHRLVSYRLSIAVLLDPFQIARFPVANRSDVEQQRSDWNVKQTSHSLTVGVSFDYVEPGLARVFQRIADGNGVLQQFLQSGQHLRAEHHRQAAESLLDFH